MQKTWEVFGMVVLAFFAALILSAIACGIYSAHEVRGYYLHRDDVYADVAWEPDLMLYLDAMSADERLDYCRRANEILREHQANRGGPPIR